MNETSSPQGAACRQNAEHIILDNIARRKRRTQAMELFHACIDWSILTKEEDELLWSLLLKME